MTKRIVIAVDATQRSLDALALGKLLAEAASAPAGLVTVFPYDPLRDPSEEKLTRVRAEARSIVVGLAGEVAVEGSDAEVIASNRAARELQHVTEREAPGVIVCGSTGRGRVGRLVPTARQPTLAGVGVSGLPVRKLAG